MALVPIVSQSWDTTSVFTPTRMNTIEQNLAIVSDATGVKYSNGVSVKDKIDSTETVETKSYNIVIDNANYPLVIKKYGKVVELWFWCDKTIGSGTLVTLEERFRPILPSYPRAIFAIDQYGGSSHGSVIMSVSYTGEIKVVNKTSTAWCMFHTSWIVG